MGLVGSITHMLLKTALSSIILWLLLVFYLEIATEKVPMLLLLVLIVNVVANLIASVLLAYKRGY